MQGSQGCSFWIVGMLGLAVSFKSQLLISRLYLLFIIIFVAKTLM